MASGRTNEPFAQIAPLAKASPLVPWIQAVRIDLLAPNGQLEDADRAAADAIAIWPHDPLIWDTSFDLAARGFPRPVRAGPGDGRRQCQLAKADFARGHPACGQKRPRNDKPRPGRDNCSAARLSPAQRPWVRAIPNERCAPRRRSDGSKTRWISPLNSIIAIYARSRVARCCRVSDSTSIPNGRPQRCSCGLSSGCGCTRLTYR